MMPWKAVPASVTPMCSGTWGSSAASRRYVSMVVCTSWAFADTTMSWKSHSSSKKRTYSVAEAASFSGSVRSSRAASASSSDPAFTPMRIGAAAAITSRVASRPPMLPGLMRNLAAPRAAASMAMRASKWMPATTGKGDAAHTASNASRQSRRGMAMRTISQPTSASASICARLAATSSAATFSIDCTATGAPPPTGTSPTMIRRVRSWGFNSLIIGIP